MKQRAASKFLSLRSVEALWSGPRSPGEPLIGCLLSLHYGAFSVVFLSWLHAGVPQPLGWSRYIELCVTVPLAGIGLLLGVVAAAGSTPRERLSTLSGLLAVSAASLVGVAVAAVGFGVGASLPLALSPFVANGCALALLRGRGDGLADRYEGVAVSSLLALVVSVLLFSVRPAPPFWVLVGLLCASALIAVFLRRVPKLEVGRRVWPWDLAVVAALAWLVFDPHLHFEMTHYNWYLGPTNAVLYGATPLVDVMSPYGVAPFYFLAAIFASEIIPISHVGLAAVISVLLIVQYATLYALLRFVGLGVAAGALALIVLILVQVVATFPGGGITTYPSLGPLRFGLPYLLLTVAAIPGRDGWGSHGRVALEAGLIGVASVWSLETFVISLGSYLGVIGYAALANFRVGAPWRRGCFLRLGASVACIALAHIGLELVAQSRAHASPDWHTFFEFVRQYTPEAKPVLKMIREIAPAVPPAGAWVAVLALYAGSLLSCVWALVGVPSREAVRGLAVIFGLTIAGVAQFPMYLPVPVSGRLYVLSLPAILVASYWLHCLRHSAPSLRMLRPLALACSAFATLLIASQLSAIIPRWLDHRSDEFPVAIPSWNGSCASFPTCLQYPDLLVPLTGVAITLLEEPFERGARVGVFLGSWATPEFLLRTGTRHAFPISSPDQDGLVPAYADTVASADHSLEEGDHLLVSKPWFSPLGRRLVRRLCHEEFACRPIAGSEGVTLLRLVAR